MTLYESPGKRALYFTISLILFSLTLSFLPSGYAETDGDQAMLQTRAIAAKLLNSLEPGQQEVNLGCMRLHVMQLRAMAGESKSGFIQEIDVPPFSVRWTDGIVYYAINPPGIADNTIDALGRTAMGREELIRESMDEWEAAAQLTFIEVPLGNPGVDNYIIFNDNADGNNSLLGKWPFPVPQNINIVSWDHPATKGVIMHEIGHALGLYHEQSRSDRDTFVEIRLENIDDDFEDQFALANSLNFGDYDFDSIMHYGRTAFSINGQNTIVMKPGFAQFQNTIGQRTILSDSDKAGMAEVYGALSPTSAPAASPPPGNYDNPVQFSLNILDAVDQGNTRYFYTLDGSDPTTSSTEYFKGDIVTINSNTTVKYFALQEQHSPSIIVTVNYTFTNPTPMVATPVFSPISGTYGPGQMISVSTSTPGADIFLTFGPTTPSQSGFQYTGPFPLNNSSQVNAKAFRAGHTPSGVATANYEIQANQLEPPPGFFPDPTDGEYASPLNVFPINNSTIIGTVLRYTVDGSEPNNTDSPIFDQTPIILTQDTTVKAKLFRDGFTPSLTSTANYNIIQSADTPIITPNGGNHSGSVDVTLTLPAKAASSPSEYIFYTTNGADPETFSSRYTTPFTLGIGTHTVKARTIYPGLPPSTIAQAQFTVFNPSPTLQSPVFKPAQGSHANSVQVSLESLTEGSTIRYTIGDNQAPADPTSNTGTLYTGPFNLGMTVNPGDRWFIRAKAFKSPDESAVIQKNYEIFTPLGDINPPVFDPEPVAGEYFDNPITVDLSATTDPPTAGVRVFRTTNGDEPVVPDPPGVGQTSVNLSGSTFLKAIAFRDFFGSSTITSASYNFKCATPTIEASGSKGVNQIGSVTVIMSSTTTGGGTTIRYATGGIEPTETSMIYTDPIMLGPGTHIFKAKTYRDDFEDSETAVASFIVEETPEAPAFLAHPMSQTVDAFTDVVFTATATGVPNPTYAWYYDGAKLGGETESSLTLYNVQVAQAGDYYAVASNSADSATSDTAELTINQVATPTPTDTIPPTDTSTPTETSTPSETPTGTLPTATNTPTPTDTIDGATSTPTFTDTPTATETMMAVPTKIILSASQDNTLIESASGELSNSTGEHFFVGKTNQGSGSIRRGIMAFDIQSQIPAGSTITGVTLTLNMSKDSAPQARDISLHRVEASWGNDGSLSTRPNEGIGGPSGPNDVTWIHRFFDTLDWTNEGGDFDANSSATTSVDGTGKYDWSSATMVQEVQDWLDNPDMNYGWILTGDETNASSAKRFDTRENQTESNRPALCIEYIPGQGPTETPTETVEQTPTETMTSESETPTETSTPTNTFIPVSIEDADVNGDGVINEFDLLAILEYWKQEVGP